jgi:hypothetical protein
MTAPHRLAKLAPLLLTACTSGLEVPERTTLTMPTEGTTLLSADGLFGVRFDAAAFAKAGQVSIQTRHDVTVEGLVSPVYEVQGERALPNAAEVFFAADDLDDPSTKTFATVDGGAATVVSTRWDLARQRLVSEGVGFARIAFGVVELGFRNGDCEARACGDACTFCAGAACLPQRGTCTLAGECGPPDAAQCDAVLEGWDDTPGSGSAYVLRSLSIATADRGFDLNGACTAAGCVDNGLSFLGEFLNDQIRQGLLGGEALLGFELAGLDLPYTGGDPGLTVKLYGLRDADDPFFPANNFRVPEGETECCQFTLLPHFLAGLPPQARNRAPGRVERGTLRTLAPVPFTLVLTFGVPPFPELRLERALLSARPSADLSVVEEGLLGGVLPLNNLAQLDNPYCLTVSPLCPVTLPGVSTVLDLISVLGGPQPDVDLDLDGLECVLDTDGDGRVDRCCDGGDVCSPTCASAVAPVDPSDPTSCALNPAMADGYSIALDFSAVRATFVGVGP